MTTREFVNVIHGPVCNICGAEIEDVHGAFHTATFGRSSDLWFLACRTHSDVGMLAFVNGVRDGRCHK